MISTRVDRATVDTKVIVSAFIAHRGFPAQVLHSWQDQAFTLANFRQIIEEYADVMSRPGDASPRLSRVN